MSALRLISATPTDPSEDYPDSAKAWKIVMATNENGISARYTGKFRNPIKSTMNIFKSDAIEEMKERIHDLSAISHTSTKTEYSFETC